MEHAKLIAHLKRLRDDLAALRPHDERERELLQSLIADVEAFLQHDEVHTSQASGLQNRLSESVARLEASHPQVTLAIRQALDSLAYLGL